MDKAIYTSEQFSLSRLLRELREQAGLRQVDMAQRLKVTQSFVSKYESGERRLDLLELRQVAFALGVPVSDVVAMLEERIAGVAETFDERAALESSEAAGAEQEHTGPAVDEPS